MKILVLCTGNSCRSQMAEGFFRKHLSDAGDSESAGAVKSAGIEAHGVNPRAIRVMGEKGLDISNHTSNELSEFQDENFDYVITVCNDADANCPVFPSKTNRLHWPFDDPAKATGTEDDILREFRRIRDEISATIKMWLEESSGA